MKSTGKIENQPTLDSQRTMMLQLLKNNLDLQLEDIVLAANNRVENIKFSLRTVFKAYKHYYVGFEVSFVPNIDGTEMLYSVKVTNKSKAMPFNQNMIAAIVALLNKRDFQINELGIMFDVKEIRLSLLDSIEDIVTLSLLNDKDGKLNLS